ncbi:MAG: cyclic nucleotide-binding domain-containing protein [Alphaproteobacteria bacterium]|nr:cyclic nucleotide-binding domain-containing protein [Alphaproteobacteria bacterium]MBT4020061.1 cyclic nucleotide-binding domain-containing protein [Alphaproteobacteria bacterium]MBT5161903.1 cyclic nucleotide-binding domain-containing protein [Alphaproteobacteria bacterium]MBT7746141.1 cyclic nucleotide-binding domain-containing protein [Alphaproteobacteria bacterium]
MDANSLRYRTFEFINANKPDAPLSRLAGRLLIALIALNVLVVVLETVETIALEYSTALNYFEIFSVTIFSVEYILRLWTCVESEDERYIHPFYGRVRYIFSPMALIDLIAILPFFLVFFVHADLRFVRVIRLLRLLKLTRYSAALSLVGSVLYLERRPLGAAAIVMLVLLIFSSSFVYLAEREAQPEAFSSIPAAMWWGIATLTTVGYGDISPITPLGRFLGAIVTVLGVGMFAMPAGILASGFAQAVKRQEFVVSWNMVASVPLFSHLEAQRIAEIVALLKPRVAVPGEIVVHKGAPGNCMYFISSGQVQVDLTGQPVFLQAGDFFGEIALIEHQTRSASVTTVTSCQLLILDEADLTELMEADDKLAADIKRISEERRAELDQTISRNPG